MTKEAERSELHKTIWKIANDLRGSVDGWDFKAYVLGMLFYRFISENLTAYLNAAEREAGNADFDYATLAHADAEHGRDEVVAEKGFFILPGELFANVRANARDDENLNETLARVFANIEASSVGTPSEDDFKGLFADLDVNSAKLGPTVAKRNEKLVKLLDAIGGLPLGGAVRRQHQRPLRRRLRVPDGHVRLHGRQVRRRVLHAPGGLRTPRQDRGRRQDRGQQGLRPGLRLGSLLLKFAKVLGHDKVRQGFYGQEINLTTYNLARINMFLHDVPFEKFDIAHGDTLTDPAHWDDEPFEAIVSNPPYSIAWPGDADVTLINDERYAPAGVLAPKSKADLAFVMHILHWLAVDGTAAIVEFPGVLYRGGAEKKIREYLVANNFVDAVIQLPPDLFFGTTIATCIIVLKKSKAPTTSRSSTRPPSSPGRATRTSSPIAHQDRILDALAARVDVDHSVKVVSNEDVLDERLASCR